MRSATDLVKTPRRLRNESGFRRGQKRKRLDRQVVRSQKRGLAALGTAAGAVAGWLWLRRR